MNLLVKKVKRVGHGFRNFTNDRLRLLLHLRRQVANSPNRKAASSTPTLGGVALLIRRRTEQIWLVTQRPTGRPWLK